MKNKAILVLAVLLSLYIFSGCKSAQKVISESNSPSGTSSSNSSNISSNISSSTTTQVTSSVKSIPISNNASSNNFGLVNNR